MEDKELQRKKRFEKIKNGFNYEITRINDCPLYLDILQDEIVVKMTSLRVALRSQLFDSSVEKKVLDAIYDSVCYLSDEFSKQIKEDKNESDKISS